jgi:hypothetical protein
VDRPAKVGEWVKVVKAKQAKDYANGDIAKVIEVLSGPGVAFTDKAGEENYLWNSEYRVLVPYDPSDPKEAAHA